jgi:hypothetical protein
MQAIALQVLNASRLQSTDDQAGWGSTVRTDTHLNYMIDMELTAEFSLADGAQ